MRKQHIVINTHSIQESLELSKQEVLGKVANWISEASGWVVNQVRRHYVNIAKYNPLEGSSYITLPPELKNRSMALLILKIRIASVFSGSISGVSIRKKFTPKGSKNQTDYRLIIMTTQAWNFLLAPNIAAELRPKTR